jgi:hypothetical protein
MTSEISDEDYCEIEHLRAINAELLEALLVARQWMPIGTPYTDTGVRDVLLVDAAIAKAKGE